MMLNAFVYNGATVQFNTPPDRGGSGEAPEMYQVTGFDSAGAQYVYDKSRLSRSAFILLFPRVTGAILATLKAFARDTVRGVRQSFAWYDHEGTAHTVRLAAEIKSTPVGPDRYRVEIALEEFTVWPLAAIPPASFAAARNAQAGSAPVWILKLIINSVAYYLSDNVFTLTGWGGQNITTLPWVAAWGQVKASITGGLNEIRIAEFDVECINDPDAAPGLAYLVTAYEVEQSPAELYQWYHGLNPATDPPQMRFRGSVRNCDLPDDTAVKLAFADEADKLQNYIGTKVDLATYPDADPDDVGKVIPIPFGTVTQGAALAVRAGAMTSLPAAISATATSFAVSDGTEFNGLAGQVVQIDSEQILITAIAAGTINNCQRSYNGTVAATHLAGAVCWHVLSAYDYLCSDVPLDAIPNVWGQVGQAIMNITAVCSRYLGSGTTAVVGAGAVGGQHPSYPGRAVVTIPGLITTAQMVNLLVADGISINDAKSIADGIGVTDGILVSDTIAISDSTTINDALSILQGSHGHSTSDNLTQVDIDNVSSITGNWAYGAPANAIDGNYGTYAKCDGSGGSFNAKRVTSVSGSGTPIQFRLALNYSSLSSVQGCTVDIYHNGGYVGSMYLSASHAQGTDYSPWFTCSSWADFYNSGTYVHIYSSGWQPSYYEMYWEVQSGITVNNNPASGVGRSGTITKSGTVTKSGSAAKSGTVSKSGTVTMSGAVSKSGTVTLTGNSIANTVVGDRVMVDKVRNVYLPGAVVGDVLTRYCNDTTLQVVGMFPASYRFDGEIVEYKRAIDWLDYFAFQCRSYYRKICGVSKLIVRPDTLTSTRTIAACAVGSDGKRVYSRSKVPISQVINVINLLFDRDWTMSKSDKAYQGISKSGNNSALAALIATSIANYGALEQPDLFQFDFIVSQVMADSLVAFYINKLAPRGWLHTFQCFLDESDVSFADAVTIGINNNIVGEVQEVGLSPGSYQQMDVVDLVVKA